MKYVFVNSVYGVRSTGKIVEEQCLDLMSQGHVVYAAYGRETNKQKSVPLIKIGNPLDQYAHAFLSRICDSAGLHSKSVTKAFLKKLNTVSPDVIWLHNLHGYYINYEMLFDWLKNNPKVRVYWTLHDCWPFTGHCAYFTMAKCDRWRDGCFDCPQKKTYPKACFADGSRKNYRRKKNAFSGLKDMTLVAPSQWMADVTRNSFLKKYPVTVLRNQIDTSIFHPIKSDVRQRMGLNRKYMVLGVAARWEDTKGLPDMLRLRDKLDDRYLIVLVGVDEREITRLPLGIVGIEHTADQRELAELYSSADVFINPTHQDNYPTVNLEAKACGTPVITYNVGGSPESVDPKNVIEEGDIDAIAQRVISICCGDVL